MLLHCFVSSKYFDLANAGVIGLNVIMMALEFYLMPKVTACGASLVAQRHGLAPPGWGVGRGRAG